MSKRMNFILPSRSVERLEKLRDMTDADSNTKVIKDALLVYEKIIDYLSNGEQFYIKDQAGNIVPWGLVVDLPISNE